MIVVHIESGLGNQMLTFCEYLALKKENPTEEIYIETIVYEIQECNKVICQWNGFELGRIFGLKPKNIKELFSESEWKSIIEDIKKTEFWNKSWNYPVYFTEVLKKHGLELKNIRGDFEDTHFMMKDKNPNSIQSKLSHTRLWYECRRIMRRIRRKKIVKAASQKDILFKKCTESIFTGQRLAFKEPCNDICKIEDEIRESFRFPEFTELENLQMLHILQETNSVAIHARRGDMMTMNAPLYKYGYFRRAVKYIKKKIEDPVFVFFCDPGSVEWCKENEKIFGLNFDKDTVHFVNWNAGDDSYKDMQLMSNCKHAIITNSSFGWWGAYFISNPDKITISPDIAIDTTHHF